MPLSTVPDAIERFRQGRMVIIVDDEDRENEGDLCLPAQDVSPEAIAFMASQGRGLVCVPMLGEQLERAGIPLIQSHRAEQVEDADRPNFAVPVDAAYGVRSGISAADRAHTIRLLISPKCSPEDFHTPGHVFPLRYTEGGVLRRRGQTEASVDLAILAGKVPAAVICEVMNESGTMACLPDLEALAEKHDIPIISVEQLVLFRQAGNWPLKSHTTGSRSGLTKAGVICLHSPIVAGMNPIDVARAAAEAASTILLERRGHAGKVSTKQNRTDLVSETDVAAEDAIVTIIRGHFPSHVIVAEEGSALGDDGEHRWYIDPLDGTSNYLHMHPFFCVSIAYEHRGELVASIIAAPTLRETFEAERGSGAWCNGERLRVSATDDLGDAMLATGFAYGIPERIANVAYWRAFVDKSSAIRRDGSAALDLAFVAAGRFDGYWEAPLHVWDIAAGLLLVTEAGGRVSDYAGGSVDIMNPAVVASNGLLHKQMLSVIAGASR